VACGQLAPHRPGISGPHPYHLFEPATYSTDISLGVSRRTTLSGGLLPTTGGVRSMTGTERDDADSVAGDGLIRAGSFT